MKKNLWSKLTYANVVSTLCLFLLLGGGAAFAAGKLAKNSVGSKQLKKNSVTAAKIKNDAVTALKIKDGSVSAAKLSGGAVSGNQLADASVTEGKIANGAVTEGKIVNGAVTDNKLATRYLAAGTVGVPVAGASVAADGTLNRWFNSAGGAPTVEHDGAGVYELIFPGLERQAYNSNSIGLVSLRQSVGMVYRSSESGKPTIHTFSAGGAPTDEGFDFTLIVPGGEK